MTTKNYFTDGWVETKVACDSGQCDNVHLIHFLLCYSGVLWAGLCLRQQSVSEACSMSSLRIGSKGFFLAFQDFDIVVLSPIHSTLRFIRPSLPETAKTFVNCPRLVCSNAIWLRAARRRPAAAFPRLAIRLAAVCRTMRCDWPPTLHLHINTLKQTTWRTTTGDVNNLPESTEKLT